MWFSLALTLISVAPRQFVPCPRCLVYSQPGGSIISRSIPGALEIITTGSAPISTIKPSRRHDCSQIEPRRRAHKLLLRSAVHRWRDGAPSCGHFLAPRRQNMIRLPDKETLLHINSVTPFWLLYFEHESYCSENPFFFFCAVSNKTPATTSTIKIERIFLTLISFFKAYQLRFYGETRQRYHCLQLFDVCNHAPNNFFVNRSSAGILPTLIKTRK